MLVNVLESLIKKAQLLSYEEKHYIFFSKSGFTKAVIDFSKHNPSIELVQDLLS